MSGKTNNNLFKEAIADAKAVKATAIANAKLALEEAFTPYLKEKLSLKLEEMDNDDEVKEEVVAETENVAEEAVAEEATEVAEETNEELQNEEFSLDELLAELEADEKSESEETITSETVNETEETESEETENEESEETPEEEEIAVEDMSTEDLTNFIVDVIKDMEANNELTPNNDESEDEVKPLGDETEAEEEAEINENEIVEEGAWEKIKGTVSGIAKAANMFKQPADFVKEMDAALKENPALKDDEQFMSTYKFLKGLSTASKASATTNVNKPMEAKLNEAYDTIDVLRKDLHEINLLNAKLLYTNKIFRDKSLTENQKIKVLSAFDKATNKKEVELVYETLKGEIKPTTIKNPIKESMSSASKTIGNSMATKSPIVENTAFSRMCELAGIKK